MPIVRVQHTLGDLASDARKMPAQFRKGAQKLVRQNAREGNKIAKAFASEQHTMFGDEDIEYPPSFTAEARGPLTWEYGPDVAIGDGTQATGYEFGSRNSPPHFDLARSVDVIGPKHAKSARDLLDDLFWPT